MRLAEPIEKSGFFWLPEKPENQVPGTLRISKSGEITLELNGLLKDPFGAPQRDAPLSHFRQQDFDRILGRVREHGLVTLERCICTQEEITVGVSSTSTLIAHFAFIGLNYEREEEVKFSEFRFSVEGLDEWLSISGFDVRNNWEEGRISGVFINYQRPNEISLTIADGIELEFNFGWKGPSISQTMTQATTTQKAFVSLKTKEPRSFEYFGLLALKVCNFFCLAIDQTISIGSVTAYSREWTRENETPKQHRVPIRVYYQSVSYSEETPKIAEHRMLFRYPDVASRIGQILSKWLDSYGTFTPAYNLYFASRYDGRQYPDVNFLRLVQGIETLHRRSSEETEMPKDEFKNHVNSILQSCPDDKRDWVKDKLSSANALPLRRRLGRMIEPFRHLFGNEEESEILVKRIVDTRNYLTHYSGKLERKAASHEDLLMLRDKLEGLFQLHLMRLIGFDGEFIASILNRNYELSRKLGT